MLLRIQMWLAPELRLFETEDARREAVTVTERPVFRGWMVWALLASPVGLYVLLTLPVTRRLFAWLRGVGWSGVVIWVLVLVTLGVYVGACAWIWQRRVRPLLRAELRRRGIRVCMGCGYDRRADPSATCPECGAEDAGSN